MTQEMARDTQWLDAEEQRVWRQWVGVTNRLPSELSRQLQRSWGLGLQDYEVLVFLTDTGDGRRRMSDLADLMQWDRSRLSHHISRMTTRGLVTREQCDEDRRGAYVVITDQGREAIRAAAPSHVTDVREFLFAGLSAEDFAALDRITRTVLDRLP